MSEIFFGFIVRLFGSLVGDTLELFVTKYWKVLLGIVLLLVAAVLVLNLI